MGFFEKVTSVLGGGIVKEVGDLVKTYFPPSMSEQEKLQFQLALQDSIHKRDMEIAKLGHEMDTEFNRRTVEMEGTASDLKVIPIIGPLLIFLRGTQRPVWGFATLWLDWQVFSSAWKLTEKQEIILLVINLLVLGFLFGERAIKNVAPLLSQFFGRAK